MANEDRHVPDMKDGTREGRDGGRKEGGKETAERKEEKEGRKEGRKKEKKKGERGEVEIEKMGKRKCKLFYNFDLTSSLSQSCFT